MLGPLAPGQLGPLAVASAPFTPASIANLKAWYDDTTALYQLSGGTTPATADGDPVGFYTDRSAAGNNIIQATAGLRPTLKLNQQAGKRALLYNAANSTALRIATLTHNVGTGDFWWIAVHKFSNPPANGTDAICGVGAFSPGWYAAHINATAKLYWSGYITGTSITLTNNTLYLEEVWRSSGIVRFAVNAVNDAATPALATSMANSAFTLGADGNSSPTWYTGLIYEYLFYASYSSTQQAALRAYLNSKWSIY